MKRVAIAIVLAAGTMTFVPAAGAAPASCTPGSGAHLAGKHLDDASLQAAGSLKCADLTGADLSGLSLIQADLSGAVAMNAKFAGAKLGQADLSNANLTGADLHGADLTQATLTDANLSGADLTHANLTQVDAAHVTLTGANLADADATQAHLSGAKLNHANVDGADFTQADLDGTDFDGAKGLIAWSTYLLIAAAVVFLLVGGLAVSRALKRGKKALAPHAETLAPAAPVSAFGGLTTLAAPFHAINAPADRTVGRGVGLGVLAAAVVAFGTHLFAGGLIGEFSFAYDTLAVKTCSGPQCAVGIGSGTIGLIFGIFVLIGGFALLSRA